MSTLQPEKSTEYVNRDLKKPFEQLVQGEFLNLKRRHLHRLKTSNEPNAQRAIYFLEKILDETLLVSLCRLLIEKCADKIDFDLAPEKITVDFLSLIELFISELEMSPPEKSAALEEVFLSFIGTWQGPMQDDSLIYHAYSQFDYFYPKFGIAFARLALMENLWAVYASPARCNRQDYIDAKYVFYFTALPAETQEGVFNSIVGSGAPPYFVKFPSYCSALTEAGRGDLLDVYCEITSNIDVGPFHTCVFDLTNPVEIIPELDRIKNSKYRAQLIHYLRVHLSNTRELISFVRAPVPGQIKNPLNKIEELEFLGVPQEWIARVLDSTDILGLTGDYLFEHLNIFYRLFESDFISFLVFLRFVQNLEIPLDSIKYLVSLGTPNNPTEEVKEVLAEVGAGYPVQFLHFIVELTRKNNPSPEISQDITRAWSPIHSIVPTRRAIDASFNHLSTRLSRLGGALSLATGFHDVPNWVPPNIIAPLKIHELARRMRAGEPILFEEILAEAVKNGEIHALARTIENLSPYVDQRIVEARRSYIGLPFIGSKIHSPKSMDEGRFQAVLSLFKDTGVTHTAFAPLHRGLTYVFDPIPTPDEWRMTSSLFALLGSFNHDISFQLGMEGRLHDNDIRAIVGTSLLLASQSGVTRYSFENLETTQDHLVDRRIMAFDDGVRQTGLPFSIEKAEGRTDMLGLHHLSDPDYWQVVATGARDFAYDGPYKTAFEAYLLKHQRLLGEVGLQQTVRSSNWVYEPLAIGDPPEYHQDMVNAVLQAKRDYPALSITVRDNIATLLRDIQELRTALILADPKTASAYMRY